MCTCCNGRFSKSVCSNGSIGHSKISRILLLQEAVASVQQELQSEKEAARLKAEEADRQVSPQD